MRKHRERQREGKGIEREKPREDWDLAGTLGTRSPLHLAGASGPSLTNTLSLTHTHTHTHTHTDAARPSLVEYNILCGN